MNIWNPKSWGRKGQIEQKSHALGMSPTLGSFLLFGTRGNAATAAGAMGLYRQSTAVSIPINYISEAFASLNPVLKTADGTVITSHPVLELLKMPSEFFDKTLFFDALAKNYLITGEAEIVAIGSVNRPPLELQPINPDNISVVEGRNGFAESIMVSGNTYAGSYVLKTSNNEARYFEGSFKELKQIRSYSTRNNSLLNGQSPLVSAAAEVRQNIDGNTHNNSLLSNGGRGSLVFHFEDDLSRDDFVATKNKVNEQFAGPDNAGRIIVTAGQKLNIEELGISNKDMDFAELQRMAIDAIALQYKVPLAIINASAATLNNYQEAKTALYDDAVLPLADRLFGGLSAFLLPRYDLNPAEIEITYNMDQITALAGRRSQELELRKKIGVETTNELRALMGREPVEGGDQVLAPANLIPVGTDLLTIDNVPTAELARDA